MVTDKDLKEMKFKRCGQMKLSAAGTHFEFDANEQGGGALRQGSICGCIELSKTLARSSMQAKPAMASLRG